MTSSSTGSAVAGVSEFEGNIWDEDVKMDAGLFIDESADDTQREALQAIFGGQAGSWPQALAESAFGEVKGIDFARSTSRSPTTRALGASRSRARPAAAPRC